MSSPIIPSWLLPRLHIEYSVQKAWIVIFLVKLTDSDRDEILRSLCSIDDSWTNRPAGEIRRLVGVPWIHDSTPPTSIIFQIAREDRYPRSLIFIDEQSRRDSTAIILNVGADRHHNEVARVPRNRANLILNVAQGKSLVDYVPNFEEVKIIEEEDQPDHDLGESGNLSKEYNLPPHLPRDLKLQPSILTLISLVHLPEQAMHELKKSIRAGEEDVSDIIIYNWPNPEEPCSRAELYRIFQSIKSPRLDGVEQAFAMFIDSATLSSLDDGYHLILADETFSTTRRHPSQSRNQLIQLSQLHDKKDALRYWRAIWNPFSEQQKRFMVNSITVNAAIEGTDLRLKKRGFEQVANPDELVFSSSSMVFILSAMKESDVRRIRKHLLSHVQEEEALQFIDMSDRIESPDMFGLVSYFESEEFIKSGTQPPSTFLAIDEQTLEVANAMESIGSNAVDGPDAEEAVIAASNQVPVLSVYDDAGAEYASINLGYAYDRFPVTTARQLLVNLAVGNMDFMEFSPDPEYLIWDACEQWVDEHEFAYGRIDIERACSPH